MAGASAGEAGQAAAGPAGRTEEEERRKEVDNSRMLEHKEELA